MSAFDQKSKRSPDPDRKKEHVWVLFAASHPVGLRYDLLELLAQLVVDDSQGLTFPAFLLVKLQQLLVLTGSVQLLLGFGQSRYFLFLLLEQPFLLLYHWLFCRLLFRPFLFDFADFHPQSFVLLFEVVESLIIEVDGFGVDHVLQVEGRGFDLHLPLVDRLVCSSQRLQLPQQPDVQGLILNAGRSTSWTKACRSMTLLTAGKQLGAVSYRLSCS